MPETDLSDQIHDAVNDFLTQIFSFLQAIYARFTRNFYASFAGVSKQRWIKVVLSVIGYLIVRPYIERFFKWSSDRERARREEKEKKQAEATGAAEGQKKPKVSANSLRGGEKDESGKVLGEVEHTDDELESEGEVESQATKFAKASGVPEFGKNARKRQKKQAKNMNQAGSNLTDEQLMELLDWSESDDGKKQ